VIAFVILLNVIVTAIPVFLVPRDDGNLLPEPTRYASFLPLGCIEITNDSGFHMFTGSGTSYDPYVLEDVKIAAGSEIPRISISNTRAHFVIRNCTFYGTGYGPDDPGGIRLENVSYGDILSCTFTYLRLGIHMTNCSYVNCNSDLIRMCDTGILVGGVGNHIVGTALFGMDSGDGIHLHDAYECLVRNNHVYNYTVGLRATKINYSSLVDNLVRNNRIGINLARDTNSNLVIRNRIGPNEDYNAIDYGSANQWNSSSVGNQWTDYSGSGSYPIPGEAGSYDYRPSLLVVNPIPWDLVITGLAGCVIVVSLIFMEKRRHKKGGKGL
jgi:hypothetical protein